MIKSIDFIPATGKSQVEVISGPVYSGVDVTFTMIILDPQDGLHGSKSHNAIGTYFADSNNWTIVIDDLTLSIDWTGISHEDFKRDFIFATKEISDLLDNVVQIVKKG